METTGKIKGISKDWESDKLIISFEVDSLPSDLESLMNGGNTLDITARRHREKRSLNANSYFHVLAGKIAEKTGETLTHEKNRLIRDYGQYTYIDGMIPTLTIRAQYEDEMLDMDGIHLKPIERPDDTSVRMALMRGSHTYNTAEMSRLIDGTVAEAKEWGIETMTPEQLGRMMIAWTKVY